MTNLFVPPPYVEHVHRLAAGLEVIDQVRRTRVASRLQISIEGQRRLQGFQRHSSGLYALVFEPGLRTPVDVLIDDRSRRYVPRRLRLPVRDEAVVSQGDPPVNPIPAARRAWRPFLFPGAAYDVGGSTTGLRGRVVAGGKPLPWARIEAKLQGSEETVGRAFGDGRGEFLLVVGDPRNLDELPATLDITVSVVRPEPLPAPPAEPPPRDRDPIWALPIEQAGPAGQPDPVLDGRHLPPSYQPGVSESRDYELALGRLTSDRVPFDLT